MDTCELCNGDGGELIWRNDILRVVRVPGNEGDMYPGFCRVIWNMHIKEMSDLSASERNTLMEVVFTIEQVLRDTLKPEKINLASLGNMTPHVHWHVIPRYLDDVTYPKPIWVQPDKMNRTKSVAVSEWVETVQQALFNM